MAPATETLPKPPSSSPRTANHATSPDSNRVDGLGPTRQIPRPPPPPSTARISLTRAKFSNEDGLRLEDPVMPSFLLDRARDAHGSSCSIDRRSSRDNAAGSTVFSKSNSAAWSVEDSDSDSEGDYSPPAAVPRRFPPIPPPQPFPLRGAADFRLPPPRHAPFGPAVVRPRAQHSRHASSTSYTSESEDSDGATRSLYRDGERRELREKMESKRRRIWQLRHGLAGKRKELRELRRRKDDMDNAFMQFLRPHLTSRSRAAVLPIDVIGERFRQMQGIRDEYYAAESAYEAMELELDHEEAELEKLVEDTSRIPRGRVVAGRQEPFFANAQPMRRDRAEAAEEKVDSSSGQDGPGPPSPVTLLGISGELHEDIHPLYQELLEAAGDRQLAKEYCEDLEMHHEKILYHLEIELHRKRVRDNQGNLISEEDLRSLRSSLTKVRTDAAEFEARFGITISEDDLEFLRDYEFVEMQARKELEEASQALHRLRELCINKGVMRKHASFHEELAIFAGSPDWTPQPSDGNMAIDPPPRPPGAGAASLAHPRFPILLSNPSHVLELLSPVKALERALKLRPKDDPAGAARQRRAECMKELGISTLMRTAESTPDYVNQWLLHRLRTCPMEAELILAVCESVFKVVNLRRWQEQVLYYWRLDDAARVEPGAFGGPVTPPGDGDVDRDGDGVGGELFARLGGVGDDDDDGSGYKLNSAIEEEVRVKSEDAEAVPRRDAAVRSVRSMG
ncbi:hypothetical protein VTK56DRAFT_158 [Thermocarpiscus australiensis]